MKNLWSPWRMSYIQSPKNKDECVFCSALAKKDGSGNYILYRGKSSFVILNRFPYTSGHLMVIPFAHVSSLNELEPEIRSEMIELLNYSTEVVKEIYQPEGFNLGANIGEAAGSGIEDHVHLHMVPRWTGDTNFMSSLADTRVIPEDLEITFQRIKEAWKL